MDYFLKKENDLRFREAWKFDIRWGMKPQAMSRSPYSGLADLVGFGFLARGLTPGGGISKHPLPTTQGVSGNVVALMPNGTTYYYFSDNKEFTWDAAVRQSNKLPPFCE